MAIDAGSSEALVSSRVARYEFFDNLNRAYLRWQFEQFRPYIGQRVLEVGCGVGGFTELVGDREAVYSLDIEEDVLEFAKTRFASRPHHKFVLADITTLSAELRQELEAFCCDTALCVNVLEHIEDEVECLRTMRSLLQPGGHICLLVPAHQWLYGEYDRVDGHFRRYSRAHMRQVVEEAGLDLVSLYNFNAVGALGWWVQYRLLRRTIHGEGQFGVMNAILPVSRAVERRLRPPVGLSLIAVCRV